MLCRYAEARWDEVMARLTEVCSAVRAAPDSPDRLVTENLKRQLATLTGERHGLVIALADAQAQISRLESALEEAQQSQNYDVSRINKEGSQTPSIRPTGGRGGLVQSGDESAEELVASKEREAAAQDLVHKAHAQVRLRASSSCNIDYCSPLICVFTISSGMNNSKLNKAGTVTSNSRSFEPSGT